MGGRFQSLARALAMLKSLSAAVERSPRAQHNLAGWDRRILVQTSGGSFGLAIYDGKLGVMDAFDDSDFVMVVHDPQLLIDWMTFRAALTNAIIEGKLWISLNREFTTIFKLDRLPRSTRRDRRGD